MIQNENKQSVPRKKLKIKKINRLISFIFFQEGDYFIYTFKTMEL